ncbi:UDP-glucuronosyltransferase 1-1 [Homalodisca vitripennis]|nr:UDP-glucuronosyltransferase 1-1 [Homalodisca vitripennis]
MLSYSYQENANRVSSIVRDQPMSPADTVVFWVEYVLRHGGAPHLKPASVYLRWYELLMVDTYGMFHTMVCLEMPHEVFLVGYANFVAAVITAR